MFALRLPSLSVCSRITVDKALTLSTFLSNEQFNNDFYFNSNLDPNNSTKYIIDNNINNVYIFILDMSRLTFLQSSTKYKSSTRPKYSSVTARVHSECRLPFLQQYI